MSDRTLDDDDDEEEEEKEEEEHDDDDDDDEDHQARSKSSRSGLELPVGRIARYMKKRQSGLRIGGPAPVYLASVLQYLLSEVIYCSGNCAKSDDKSRITPRHIQLAIRNDRDLDLLVKKYLDS